jgi:hypothetical protein
MLITRERRGKQEEKEEEEAPATLDGYFIQKKLSCKSLKSS